MTVPLDSSISGTSANWLFKNKEHGKTSAAASLVCVPCYFRILVARNFFSIRLS